MSRHDFGVVDKGQMVHVKLPRQTYERMRYHLMQAGFPRGGITSFIVESIEHYLLKQESRPLTFEEAFRGQWRMSPTALDKWRCYGAAIDKEERGPLVRQVGRFTMPELQQHHDTSRWDERTYVLVDEQIQRHRQSGLRWEEQRGLIPPVPKAVIPEEPHTPLAAQQEQLSGAEQMTQAQLSFDPHKQCFLMSCPQLETCTEARGCCADPEEDET